jgi:serine/threonine protein kinase
MDTTIFGAFDMSVEGAVYETALALEGREREAFLDKVFFGDPKGRARMARLLKRSGESAAFFLEVNEHGAVLAEEVLENSPAAEAVLAEEPELEGPDSQFGPYRLISQIGEGGCGVVYEAEQLEPVRRRVALKIIRMGMNTRSVIARFEAERQALALMDHPNIARVFDAGETTSGRPYFVMERVSGERITKWCDSVKLNVVGRINLFIRVCHGIQHAHQKGVIHCDIKPSNILVTMQDGAPMPKVIDFGIARAAAPSDTPTRALRAMPDQFIGTPSYMSPEQVSMSGMDVDTRSDVYSLGALLYELLGGRAPFNEQSLEQAGIAETRRTLLEDEPPLLSRMLADLPEEELAKIALARGEEPRKFLARMRGDLEWIVAGAMAKNRNHRYQTVNALAADLGRYLNDEPVSTHKASRIYLLEKFVRRNRAACFSAMAVVVSLVAGLGTSTFLYLSEKKALAEQARLSREAESARKRETWLREQAQARANVSRVAVLLGAGKIEQADALLSKSPLETIEPSREAADVFRALGNWNALYGRWKQAVQCYVLLDQANRFDNPEKTVEEGSDLLAIGPALLANHDLAAYDKFRLETLDYYFPAKNSVQAERLLKICLLKPANSEILGRLKGAAEICARGVPTQSGMPTFPQWEALSMTLYNHRCGNIEQTLEWGRRSFNFPDPAGSRLSAVLSLTAMAHYRAGDKIAAVRDLEKARRFIEEGKLMPLAERGSWFSWVIADILQEEASGEIGNTALPGEKRDR